MTTRAKTGRHKYFLRVLSEIRLSFDLTGPSRTRRLRGAWQDADIVERSFPIIFRRQHPWLRDIRITLRPGDTGYVRLFAARARLSFDIIHLDLDIRSRGFAFCYCLPTRRAEQQAVAIHSCDEEESWPIPILCDDCAERKLHQEEQRRAKRRRGPAPAEPKGTR